MISVVVKNVVKETRDIVRLVLGSEDGGALPFFEAGAHIDVHLPSGLIRQYSLCRLSVEAQYYEIAVLKDAHSRGGSAEVHQLKIGDILFISAPKNHFALVDGGSRHSVLIAGGIGVTPLLPMAQQLRHLGQSFEFHYCGRTSETAAFTAALKNGSFADNMHFHFSQEAESGRMEVSRVLSGQAEGAVLYICGPASFIEEVLQQARALGWPEDCLHREFFSAPALNEHREGNDAFQIKIHSTGEILHVAADESMFEVLDKHGVFVPVSCESGVCGSCQTGVVSGVPDHRDVFLTDKEHQAGKLVMPCCSRALTPVLELDL
ncbi:PDR/VanB family oxidoreductase [Marinomonas sp. IMCC 4694]|uniref:PDR/VanB family oxidoreductase n=1 Tax=Marinomonas sp. IMCC 4694 TaxID=2605432 RepID=UPI0011E6B8E1|nr:PDR/VanB family oxidoreductase [Marinomonas sp. IMCC 4694]TYL47256.1 oxidoreductase [Marinomonas sp. IMCC 4694]